MDKEYLSSYKLIVNITKISMNMKKQHDSLLKIAMAARQKLKPRPKLPISVPFNIFQAKKITDKETQTDITMSELFVFEEIEEGTQNLLPKTTETNISTQVDEEKSQSKTPIMDKEIENKATVDKKDFILNKNISTMTDQTVGINNEINELFNAIISPDEDEDSNFTKHTNIPDIYNSQKTVDNNDKISNADKTGVGGNDAMKDIFGSSENYKIFARNIYTSIGKLLKSGVFSKNITKLNNISTLFDYVIVYCIKEFKENKYSNKDLNTEDYQNKGGHAKDQVKIQETPTEIPFKKRKNIESEIDLQLQTMKQERKDDDEDTTEFPDGIGASMDLLPEHQIEVLRSEIFNRDKQNQQQIQQQNIQVQQYHHQQEQQQKLQLEQQKQQLEQQKQQLEKQKQQQPQQIKSTSYDPYFNLFMTQQQNQNGNNTIKDTRQPCPQAMQNLAQNQTYNHNYYSNQESVKNYRHPYKRYTRPNTPYQRPQQINKVPTPQPPLPQQPYTYPSQYYHQQNLHMQPHMQGTYPQNTQYH